jgi:hypothetical protein
VALSSGCGDGGGASDSSAAVSPARPADPADVRAKRRCLKAAGLRTTARRREPEDDDAPDVRLLLMGRGTQAFVAIYADLARAKRYEPQIRQNVKPFDGSVERAGHVTIAWVRRPQSGLLADVRGCLFS